ncbi:Glutaredoxin domain-containing cysteine-rich protein [Thalictrum thalictroides]|uniref:Glutaredoxin domain-containing cysteine-rich protein n=1 Tax=Thalictrum thalictroides TaxID=46969 RepID=A0A7J6W010_THATH|nr:Glutaredoxin domain-containing cysteine-rich protein [Thalictrum thalictroides]
MKGVKGKFIKKLKSMKPIGALKQTRILQISALNGFLDPSSSPTDPNRVMHHSSSVFKEKDHKAVCFNVPMNDFDVVDVSQLMKDLEDEEMEFSADGDNKENIGPLIKVKKDPLVLDKEKFENSTLSESGCSNLLNASLLELDVSSFQRLDSTPLKENSEVVDDFRRPDLNSGSLFDPNLLAAFERAKMEHFRAFEAVREARIEEKKREEDEEPPLKARRLEDDPLMKFEERCPPGGSESVILYTTSLRGIRKTFEDCQSIRFLLDSFRILFYERDVSMHLDFREEMWRILGARLVPPRLFIKGRYIGGADVVVGLHEQGKLLQLLEGLPRDETTSPCNGCGGIRFILCYNCNGSQKVTAGEGNDVLSIQCTQCNENGLIICPMCC